MNEEMQPYPPLEVIQDRLFGEPEAVAEAADLAPEEPPLAEPAMPTWMKAVVADAVALDAEARPTLPAPGQIWSVAWHGEAGGRPIGGRIPMLLDALQDNGAWRGWLMSPDSDYATRADVILDAHALGISPAACMVQTWNRVCARVDAEAPWLGQVDSGTLLAVRAVAGQPQPSRASRGVPCNLAMRKVRDGLFAVTGDHLGDIRDPRWAYRRLYLQLAATFSQDISLDYDQDA